MYEGLVCVCGMGDELSDKRIRRMESEFAERERILLGGDPDMVVRVYEHNRRWLSHTASVHAAVCRTRYSSNQVAKILKCRGAWCPLDM